MANILRTIIVVLVCLLPITSCAGVKNDGTWRPEALSPAEIIWGGEKPPRISYEELRKELCKRGAAISFVGSGYYYLHPIISKEQVNETPNPIKTRIEQFYGYPGELNIRNHYCEAIMVNKITFFSGQNEWFNRFGTLNLPIKNKINPYTNLNVRRTPFSIQPSETVNPVSFECDMTTFPMPSIPFYAILETNVKTFIIEMQCVADQGA